MQIILASTSPYRKAQLKALGLRFRAVRPEFDEKKFSSLNPKLSPKLLCRKLAEQKALSLQSKYPDAVIIGADQLVSFKGKILGKPGSLSRAEKQLASMSGQTHELITSVSVVAPTLRQTHVVVAKVQMRKLSKNEIRNYVRRDKPTDCAGSYKFERAGLSLMDKVVVNDPSALIGLPLIKLCKSLKILGLKI